MQNIAKIIINLFKLPFAVIKWTFYGIIIYIFMFGIGFVIDKNIGWHPVIKPIRDSALIITIGIIKKTTPYLQKIAAKFEKNKQATAHSAEIIKVQKVDEANNVNANISDEKDALEHTERQHNQADLQKLQKLSHSFENTPIIQKLTESITTMQKSMETIYKKANTQQQAYWKPEILYGLFTFNILVSLIIAYILYQKT